MFLLSVAVMSQQMKGIFSPSDAKTGRANAPACKFEGSEDHRGPGLTDPLDGLYGVDLWNQGRGPVKAVQEPVCHLQDMHPSVTAAQQQSKQLTIGKGLNTVFSGLLARPILGLQAGQLEHLHAP